MLEISELEKQSYWRRMSDKSDCIEVARDLYVFFKLSRRLVLAQLGQTGVVTTENDVCSFGHSCHQHRGLHALVHRRQNAAPLRTITMPHICKTLGIYIAARKQ